MVKRTIAGLLEKIADIAGHIDAAGVEDLVEQIKTAPAIFVDGAGRSGLVAKAFAMRLMHLGFMVHVVGDTTTPGIKRTDLLIAISGSGETPSVKAVVHEAKSQGAKVAGITASPDSSMASECDTVVVIPGKISREGPRDYQARQLRGDYAPLTPLGTAFELTAMVLCDAIVVELMRGMNLTEDAMAAKHATF